MDLHKAIYEQIVCSCQQDKYTNTTEQQVHKNYI